MSASKYSVKYSFSKHNIFLGHFLPDPMKSRENLPHLACVSSATRELVTQRRAKYGFSYVLLMQKADKQVQMVSLMVC
jgi:hypothetical protein